MVRSIIGCGTLFGMVLVGELVVCCVSFCVISFIAVSVGNCDSGVSSIIVGGSGVVCDGWLSCCADSFCSSTSDVLLGFHLRSGCLSYITRTHLLKMWTAFGKCSFMLEHLYTRVVGMVGNVCNGLFCVVYSVYVAIFFNVECHFVFLCFEGKFKKEMKIKILV